MDITVAPSSTWLSPCYVRKTPLKKFVLLTCLLLSAPAFSETCVLQTYASSWMATGTPFSVQCPSGEYTGHLISTPARRFFRRGHLLLKFDQPVIVRTKNPADEGKIQASRGRQIADILTVGGAGIGAKDITDGIAGAVYKSWYAIPITCVTLSFFSKGGDVNLKRGDTIEVIPLRGTGLDSGASLPGK